MSNHKPSIGERTGGSSRKDGNINSKEKDYLERKKRELGNVSYKRAKSLLKNYRN